jgi:hypothetical protein
MSGLEIAGVALGVLPILVEVVKSYSTVSKKLRTLRHCSREVKSIWERLKVHKGIFMNEVRLLLQLIEDEADVERMLEDTGDPRWTSQQLNEKLSAVLKTSFEICCGIVEDTKGIVDSMQNELKKFDVLLDQKSKVSVPARASHLRHASVRGKCKSSIFVHPLTPQYRVNLSSRPSNDWAGRSKSPLTSPDTRNAFRAFEKGMAIYVRSGLRLAPSNNMRSAQQALASLQSPCQLR